MMKGEFEIPNDIKTDLAYCQQAIANHVKFHQVNFFLQSTFLKISDRCGQQYIDSHVTSSLFCLLSIFMVMMPFNLLPFIFL